MFQGGGIQVELCQLIYLSHVINMQHSDDLLHVSRFTKQFPSNDFYKHFICFKLLITLLILLCILHFKLIYNCVSNNCFLILKLFYQTHAFKLFYRLTSSRSFLKILLMFQMSYKNLFMLLYYKLHAHICIDI